MQSHLHEAPFPNTLHHGHDKTIKGDQFLANPFLIRKIVDVPKILLSKKLNG